MIKQILSADQNVTNLINSFLPHNNFFDWFFSFFSLKGNSLIVWIIVIILVAIIEELINPGVQKKDIKFIIYFFIAFGITYFLVNIIFKNIFQRPRPVLLNVQFSTFNVKRSTLNVNCPSDYSFPSGHASTAFAAAATLSFFDKRRKYFYYFIASLISLSRIYLGCHYFLDVVAGAILGYLLSKLILFFSKEIKWI